MEELINVAEELYKQIGNAQVHFINARLYNDRKDNIVDLSEA